MLRAVLGIAAIMVTHASLASRDAVLQGNAVTILALGTSMTANYQWPHELARELNRCFDQKIYIEVLATAGANSTQADYQFSSRKNRMPDVVMIEFASNDADLLDGVTLDKSRLNHNRLLVRIREEVPRSKVMLMTMSPVFGVRSWFRPRLAHYYAMYRELAKNKDVVLVDIVNGWNKFFVISGDEEFPDGLHPRQSLASRIVLPEVLNQMKLILGEHRLCGAH